MVAQRTTAIQPQSTPATVTPLTPHQRTLVELMATLVDEEFQPAREQLGQAVLALSDHNWDSTVTTLAVLLRQMIHIESPER